MSDRPSLAELQKALNSLSWSDFQIFAVHLGGDLDLPTLTRTEENRPTTETRILQALHTWLERDLEASWEKVVSALENINKNDLAQQVQSKYCPDAHSCISPLANPSSHPIPAPTPPLPLSSLSPSSQSPVSIRPSPPPHVDTSSQPDLPRAESTTQPVNSPELRGTAVAPSEKARQIAEEASQLEMHFVSVVADTEVQFSKKAAKSEDFLNKFCVTLTTLPFSRKFKCLKFLTAEKQRLRIAKDINEIFDVLKPYLKYTDYSLLQHIIQKFGGQKLKQEMEKYVAALEEFEKRVSVDDIQSVSFKRELPRDFKPLQFKIEVNSSSCSLYGARKIREAITNEAALEPYVDILLGVSPSSVTITLAFPSRVLALVASSMNKAFLKSHKILSVSLDSKPLEVYVKQGKELSTASRAGDMATVTSLLQNGADVNFVDDDQKTALHCASEEGHHETVQLLLEKGADPNVQNKDQKTALHLASERGHHETVQLLLEKGADPNVQDVETALHYASRRGHHETVQLLLEKGADPNVQDKLFQETALHYASRRGDHETVQLLLEKGADPNVQDKDQETALHYASERGHLETVQLLLEKGADPNVQDKLFQETALHYASRRGHHETVQLLLEKGADPNVQDVDQETALHYASERGHLETVQLLLENGADPNVQDKWGRKAKPRQKTSQPEMLSDSPKAYSTHISHTYTKSMDQRSSGSDSDSFTSGVPKLTSPDYYSHSTAPTDTELDVEYSPTTKIQGSVTEEASGDV